jgi:hypothetical protein
MKDLIPPRQIRALRKVANMALPDRCTIYTPPDPATATRTPGGAIKDTYPTYWQKVERVACRVTPIQRIGMEGAGAGTVQAIARHAIAFGPSVVIDETCRVRITASKYNPQLIGTDFDVTEAPLSSYNVGRTIQAVKKT